jgi:hypothetical protein
LKINLKRGTHFFKKSRRGLEILGARIVTGSQFHSDDVQISRATVQNVFALAGWHPGLGLSELSDYTSINT